MAQTELWRNHSIETSKDSSGITTAGSFSYWADSPVSDLKIGDEFQPVPGGPTLKVGKVSISDSVIGERFGRPFRQWQITVEGDSNVQSSEDDEGDTNVKYSFQIEKSDEGLITTTGTMEVVNTGSNPSITIEIGGSFNVPGIGSVACTKIAGGDEYTDSGTHKWTVTYTGAKTGASEGDDPTLPESEEEVTYEINGTTVRSISGEFIALRRSETPITRRSLTVYNNSASALTTPGEVYTVNNVALGIAVSETVTKETQTVNGVEVGAYYSHRIEVES